MIDVIDGKHKVWERSLFDFLDFLLSVLTKTYYQQRHQLNSGCNMLFHVFTLLNLVFMKKNCFQTISIKMRHINRVNDFP